MKKEHLVIIIVVFALAFIFALLYKKPDKTLASLSTAQVQPVNMGGFKISDIGNIFSSILGAKAKAANTTVTV